MAVKDGIYGVFYTGQLGSGALMLCVRNNNVLGLDPLGGKITGSLELQADKVIANMLFEMQPGQLATGHTLERPMQVSKRLVLSPNFFEGEVAAVDIGFGLVNARGEFVGDLP